ncbi:MAG: PaaI family thioesterase [Candidatus Sericytochromatia bacterium]
MNEQNTDGQKTVELSDELSESTLAFWQNRIATTPFLRLLGIELGTLARGACTLTMAIKPEHLQQDGFVHAGVQATLADHACGTAAATCMGPKEGVLSIEFKLNLLKPARGERISAVARVIRAGRCAPFCTH